MAAKPPDALSGSVHRPGARTRRSPMARLQVALALAVVAFPSTPSPNALAAPGDPDSSSADTSAFSTANPHAFLIPQTPPDYPRVRLSGEFFLDYYYNANGDPRHLYSATGADSG